MKGQNIKNIVIKDLNLMCKTDEKTRNYINVFFRATKCPTEAEKIEYVKMRIPILVL